MSGGPAVREVRVSPDDWDRALAMTEGHQIVVGGPGTGKSEFLVRRAVHLLETSRVGPEQILVLSFGRRGTADLQSRLRTSMRGSTGRVDVTTFHSYAMRLLEAHGREIGWTESPRLLTGPEQTALVRELLADEEPHGWAPIARTLLRSRTFAVETADFVLRAGEQLLEPKHLRELAAGIPEWTGLPGFVERYRRALADRGSVDYAMLLGEAVRLLEGRSDLAGVDYVLVDEYQDTTTAQVRLLEALTGAGSLVTAAGDPAQSIYGFRGTALTNVVEFPPRFADSVPVTRLVLTTSFRSPRLLLAAAERLIEGTEVPGGAGAVLPAPGDGRVEARVFEQQTAEAEWVADEITHLHLTDGIPLGRIGVLVRSKRRFLPELSRALDRRRVPHDDADVRLGEQPAVRFVVDVVRATTSREPSQEGDRAIRRMLLGPGLALPLGRLRDIERLRSRESIGWPQAITRVAPEAMPLAVLLADPSWATQAPAAEGFWKVWTALPGADSIATSPHRQDERSAWASLGQVLERWTERHPGATLQQYVQLVEDQEFEARPLLSYRKAEEDRVVLTTVHQCKGLEFEVVFVCDAVDGVFPDLRPRDSILGTRRLLAHLPDDAAQYRAFRLQEERRLAYTAVARASRRVVWTATATGFEDGAGMPSRLLPLVAGPEGISSVTRSETTPPVTVREAETFLRRLIADPAVAAPKRLAAVAALASGERWGLRPPVTIEGVRPRGRDDGLVDAMVLSPSQGESYERCPRRYALERRLRVGDSTSFYGVLGSLVHDVLERVERAAAEPNGGSSTLATAVAEFDRSFDPEAFGDGPYAEAWRRRGHGILERLYRLWPRWGDVVDLERDVSLEVDGVRWVGRVDRIEARDGEVKIIDYKTSKRLPTKADASESLQLGFYLLACRDDAEIRAAGFPLHAEAWFPAVDSKSLSVREFDVKRVDDLQARLAAVTDGIGAERWPAIPNPDCERCPVRVVCPAWPEGGEPYA